VFSINLTRAPTNAPRAAGLAVVAKAAAEAAAEAAERPCRPRRVLIVDDEPAVAAATAALLCRWGHAAVAVHGEAEAWSACQPSAEAADLLIVDFRLAGGRSGLDLAARLQGLLSRRLQVIVMTGDTDPERLREAAAAGHLLLHKPVDPQRLRAEVDAMGAPNPSDSPQRLSAAGFAAG